MSSLGDKFMYLFVIFDLPTYTKKQRHNYSIFRKYLIKDGFVMMQYSIYFRLCNGRERIDKHFKKLEDNLPESGHVRSFELTEIQFKRMKLLVGHRTKNEKMNQGNGPKQLLLF